MNFWIENDPPPPLELFQKFIPFGGATRPYDLKQLVTFHTVSHVTLLVSSGKFTGGLDFSGGALIFLQGGAVFPSGGRFILFRGALIFFQGGTFLPVKNARLNSGGPKPP